MGRKAWSEKKTAEECRTLSIAALAKSGLLRGSTVLAWAGKWPDGYEVSVTHVLSLSPQNFGTLGISYQVYDKETGTSHEVKDTIEVTAIPSPLGRGQRFYFLCPGWDGEPCGQRAGMLYLPPGEEYFRCRACHDLTYRSCKEHDKSLDPFLRLSPEELAGALESPDMKTGLRALQVAADLIARTSGG